MPVDIAGVPCCIMYFSFWYKPSERAFRIAVFHSANALASAVSGFLAIAINNVSGNPKRAAGRQS